MPATKGSRKATASKATFDAATATATRRTTRASAAATGYTMADVAKHDKVRRGSMTREHRHSAGNVARTLTASQG